jgi:hypothetical protein
LERENASSTPTCCNCQLEAAHPANYRGCSHASDEMWKKKFHGKPKPTTGRMFSSNFTTPTVSFAAALQGTPEQNQRNNLRHEAVPGKNKHEGMKKGQLHETDHSVRDPTVSSLPLDNMFKVAIVVQQSMTEFSNAETEEAKTRVIAKLVSYIMKQNGH